jgi:hypothetical protein
MKRARNVKVEAARVVGVATVVEAVAVGAAVTAVVVADAAVAADATEAIEVATAATGKFLCSFLIESDRKKSSWF